MGSQGPHPHLSEEEKNLKVEILFAGTESRDGLNLFTCISTDCDHFFHNLFNFIKQVFDIFRRRRSRNLSWSHKMLVWTQTKVGRNIIAPAWFCLPNCGPRHSQPPYASHWPDRRSRVGRGAEPIRSQGFVLYSDPVKLSLGVKLEEDKWSVLSCCHCPACEDQASVHCQVQGSCF